MRRFPLAMHNENIPACGDAERIGPWVARDGHAGMPACMHGLIAMREIRDEAANILKNRKQVHLQRKGKEQFDQC